MQQVLPLLRVCKAELVGLDGGENNLKKKGKWRVKDNHDGERAAVADVQPRREP